MGVGPAAHRRPPPPPGPEDAQKEAAQLKAVNSSLVAEQRAGLAAVKEALAEAAAVKGKLAVAEAAERQRAAEAEGLRGQLAAERSQAAARLEQQAMQQKVPSVPPNPVASVQSLRG